MFYARSRPIVTSRPHTADPAPSARGVLRHLAQWLLPCPCLGCRAIVWQPGGSLGLCEPCRRSLLRWPDTAPEEAADTGSCDRKLSTWCYEAPLDAVIMGLKFRRLDYLGEHLGRAMAAIHGRRLADCEVVTAVPLYWTRLLYRGYNQAVLIARPIAAELGLPFVRLLKRRRSTAHQTRLSRGARLVNLESAFAVRRTDLVEGRRVLLVDDVTTTGATLEAAAACLKQAGARSVAALTAARTPTAAERARLPRGGAPRPRPVPVVDYPDWT